MKLYRNALVAGVLAMGLAACGDKVTVTQQTPPTPGVTSVTVAPSNVTMTVGQSVVFAASVVADAGVATSVNWSSGDNSIATVDATGKVTAVSAGSTTIIAASTADAGKRGVGSVTVVNLPPNITSFTVTPTTATLAPGNFVQAVAQIVMANGATAPTPSWSTSNSAIAQVDGTGKITAVSAGSAIITASITSGGQTATATIGITVRQLVAGTVSISSVTAGLTTLPVVLTNVAGQIEFNLNFNPGEQTIDSLAVFIGAKRAAKQSFVTNPAAGIITLSVNTANFTKNAAAGTATVDYLNGNSTISAAIYPHGVATATATELTPIVLNNADGWAADITKPTNNANSAAGLTYWGGPSANGGNTTAEIYPVIYTPGRSISTVTWTLGPAGAAGCSTTTQTALPFTRTFGYTAAAGGTAAVSCTGYENTTGVGGVRDNIVVTAALDNANNTFPLVIGAAGLIPNTVVLGATPDSLRLDYVAPTVSTPSIARSAPAVTGWVNAGFNFINFASTDLGVGLRAARDRATFWNSVNCTGVVAAGLPMATGTGADINGGVACPTNFIGGAVGLGGTAPWTVFGTESDRLNNKGTSGNTATFGTDYTAPAVRWGLADAAYTPALPAAYGGSVTDPVDSILNVGPTTPKVAGQYGEFRVEYLDDRSGNGSSTEKHSLAVGNHLNPAGACVVGSGVVGATFVTNPGCTMATATPLAAVRTDGWFPGQRVNVPLPEGYYGYKANITDAAGNTSVTLFRSVLVNAVAPFSTGVGLPAQLTSANFPIGATAADSAEVSALSLQVVYPGLPTVDSLRYPKTAVGTSFDDVITSPYAGNIFPAGGAPYKHSIEVVDATAFPGVNTSAGVPMKPTKVLVWSWNFGGFSTPAASETALPGLNVEGNSTVAAWNAANPTIAVNHFRVIATVSTGNNFGSTVPLRAQVVSPTNAPNPPFARVEFYRQVGGAYWSYLGSVPGNVVQASTACTSTVAEVCGTDQGVYRSWIYQLPTASYVKRWDGATQTGVVSTDLIIAVGVLSTGDAVSTLQTTMVP